MDYKDLVNEGKLKREPAIGADQIERLLKRGKKDLTTAKKLIEEDEELALATIYDAMFHAANALIRMQGYRPGSKMQHLGIIEAVRRTLGGEAKNLVIKFDTLRVARNRFEYQAIFNMSRTQLEKALNDATELVAAIEKFIQEKNPQKHFKF